MADLSPQLETLEQAKVLQLVEETRTLVQAVSERTLECRESLATLFRWLGQLEAFRVATTNAVLAQTASQGISIYDNYYSSLYREVTAGYKQQFSPLAWHDINRAENLLVLENLCSEYLNGFEEVLEVDSAAVIAQP